MVYANMHKPKADSLNSVFIDDNISGEVYCLIIEATNVGGLLNNYKFGMHETEDLKFTKKEMGIHFK